MSLRLRQSFDKVLETQLHQGVETLQCFQAKDKESLMEMSITEAQQTEQKVLEFQDWLTHIDILIQSRLDADLLANDVPDEFQVSPDWQK